MYAGAGKVGREGTGGSSQPGVFQISQRADFFEEVVGLETTLKRPIVNTRDEPHADPQKYRRLHVITGDANLAEVATFLKVGVTALLLMLVEDDAFGERELVLANPVQAMHEISLDPTLRQVVELAGGERLTALELQWELFGLARKYADERGLAELGPEPAGEAVLARWEATLAGLEHDPATLRHQLDWVAKRELIAAYCERHSCAPDDHRVAALDLQYHDLRPARSLFRRLDMERLVDEAAVDAATRERSARHTRVLPRRVPEALPAGDRGRELGLDRLRSRRGPAAAGTDDGTVAGNRSSRRYALRRVRQPDGAVTAPRRLGGEAHG